MKSPEQTPNQEVIIGKSIEASAEKLAKDKENALEELENGELLTAEEQRTLFRQLLKEKLYGRETLGKEDVNVGLAEQIKQLAENGMIENLSLDLKTGRIHFKYKPKQKSLLNSFVNWVMEYDTNRAKKLMANTPHFGNVTDNRFGGAFSSKAREEFYAKKHQQIAERPDGAQDQGDSLESLRELGIQIEKDGEDVSILFDQESSDGKTAVEALSKSIESKDEEEPKFKAGNSVQWNSSGANQWESPKVIEKFSDDGKFAFFEGSFTGIPVEQLVLDNQPMKKVEKVESEKKEEVKVESDKEKISKVRESLGLKEDDFFSKFTKNPDQVLSGFKDRPRGKWNGTEHTVRENIDVVTDTMKEIYPDSKKRAERFREIFSQFDEIKKKAKIDSPGKDEHGYEAFAIKRVIALMPTKEKELFLRAVDEKINAGAGKNIEPKKEFGVSLAFSPEMVLTDFIDVLSKLGAVEK